MAVTKVKVNSAMNRMDSYSRKKKNDRINVRREYVFLTRSTYHGSFDKKKNIAKEMG
jgi:hypothetical protein